MMRKMQWGLAIALVAATGAAPALADVKAGVEAWSRGDYRQAVEEWRTPAIRGDADAQFNLAQAYKLGRGVPIDLPMAESWYRRAALQGHPQAEDNYGLALFQNGKRDEAAPWLERSAARGEPRAQYVLGTMLFNGDGVAKDWVRAYALTTRASQVGLPQAGQSLAQMDRYLSPAERQKGTELARRLETESQRALLPPPAAPTGMAARDPDRPTMAARALPGADYPVPDARPTPPRTMPPPAAPARAVAAVPKPAPAAKPAPSGWRVQLGAFRDLGNAEALWQRVRARSGLSRLTPFMVRAGGVTKLQAGPLASSTAAAQLCRQVKAAGLPCLTVGP